MKVNNGDVFTRNGNFFIVKKTSDGHYYTALLLGHAKITAWHRISKKKLTTDFVKVEDYEGKGIEL